MLIIVMGVSGSGKSSVAQALAKQFSYEYIEADDFHTDITKQLMAEGRPLDDTVRAPWIDSMCTYLKLKRQSGINCILAYSGLRREHRQRFRELGFDNLFLFLQADQNLIHSRVDGRDNHFFPTQLVQSQFDSLQQPRGETDVVSINASKNLATVIDESLIAVKLKVARKSI
ncbi:MAG: gluconokinase, GntK/IdnK-type [Pseudomonadales bacterium]